MRPFRLSRLMMAGLLILLVPWIGCGKKGDPIPRQIKPPQAIADLNAVSRGKGILLAWSLPDPPEKIGSFKLVRSETVEGSEACPGCPQDYKPLRTLALTDDRLQRGEERKFSYVDWEVSVGHFYSYRIVVCDVSGFCGAESNAAGAIHTAPEEFGIEPRR